MSPNIPRISSPIAVGALLLLFFVAGCSREHDHSHPPPSGNGGHSHEAPHGGVLVELGDHQYSVEFVFDPATGRLDAYFLDGHASHFVRVAQPELTVTVRRAGARNELKLRPIANPITGETVGDTAMFSGQADWLRGAKDFDGAVGPVTVRGSAFPNITFSYRADQSSHDHPDKNSR